MKKVTLAFFSLVALACFIACSSPVVEVPTQAVDSTKVVTDSTPQIKLDSTQVKAETAPKADEVKK